LEWFSWGITQNLLAGLKVLWRTAAPASAGGCSIFELYGQVPDKIRSEFWGTLG
jgi:hypothetical protein